jgi:hypothetical protein
VLLAADWGLGVWAALNLPKLVPVHWNLQDQVDGWGASWQTAFLWPVIATGLYAALLFADFRPSARRLEGPSVAATQRKVRWIFSGLFVGMHCLIVAQTKAQLGFAFSFAPGLGRGLMLLLAAFAVLMGNLMPRLENRHPGQRALSRATHRFAGRWLVVMGLIQFLSACFLKPLPMLLVFGGSYVVWTALAIGCTRAFRNRQALEAVPGVNVDPSDGTSPLSRFDLLPLGALALCLPLLLKARGYGAWLIVGLPALSWGILWLEVRFLATGSLQRSAALLRGWVVAGFVLGMGAIQLSGSLFLPGILLSLAFPNVLVGIGQFLAKRTGSPQDRELWQACVESGGTLWNREDPRILVPKFLGEGWSCNFARVASWILLLAMLTPIGIVILSARP